MGFPYPQYLSAALCVAIAVSAVRRWGEPPAVWLLAGAALYLAMMVLSFAYHIPRLGERLGDHYHFRYRLSVALPSH